MTVVCADCRSPREEREIEQLLYDLILGQVSLKEGDALGEGAELRAGELPCDNCSIVDPLNEPTASLAWLTPVGCLRVFFDETVKLSSVSSMQEGEFAERPSQGVADADDEGEVRALRPGWSDVCGVRPGWLLESR